MTPLNVFIDLVEIIVSINAQTFATFSGWLVATLSVGFLYWRLKVWDDRMERRLVEVADALHKVQEELREQISEINDVQFNLVTDATKTLAVLSEKIGSLQLFMQMFGGTGKTRR